MRGALAVLVCAALLTACDQGGNESTIAKVIAVAKPITDAAATTPTPVVSMMPTTAATVIRPNTR